MHTKIGLLFSGTLHLFRYIILKSNLMTDFSSGVILKGLFRRTYEMLRFVVVTSIHFML